MNKDLKELRKTAEAATQADWYALRVGMRDKKEWVVDSHPTFICSMQIDGERAKSDAEFIATFNPETALSLLSRLEQAEQAVQRVREFSDQMLKPHGQNVVVAARVRERLAEILDGDTRRLADDALGGGQHE